MEIVFKFSAALITTLKLFNFKLILYSAFKTKKIGAQKFYPDLKYTNMREKIVNRGKL